MDSSPQPAQAWRTATLHIAAAQAGRKSLLIPHIEHIAALVCRSASRLRTPPRRWLRSPLRARIGALVAVGVSSTLAAGTGGSTPCQPPGWRIRRALQCAAPARVLGVAGPHWTTNSCVKAASNTCSSEESCTWCAYVGNARATHGHAAGAARAIPGVVVIAAASRAVGGGVREPTREAHDCQRRRARYDQRLVTPPLWQSASAPQATAAARSRGAHREQRLHHPESEARDRHVREVRHLATQDAASA